MDAVPGTLRRGSCGLAPAPALRRPPVPPVKREITAARWGFDCPPAEVYSWATREPTADGIVMLARAGDTPNVIAWSIADTAWTELFIPEVVEGERHSSDEKLRCLRRAFYKDVLYRDDEPLITSAAVDRVANTVELVETEDIENLEARRKVMKMTEMYKRFMLKICAEVSAAG